MNACPKQKLCSDFAKSCCFWDLNYAKLRSNTFFFFFKQDATWNKISHNFFLNISVFEKMLDHWSSVLMN